MLDAANAIENPGTINARDTGIDSKNHKSSFCTPIHDSGFINHW
ncbi:uncharacterized protein METZ01_LOCUS370913 [marine metagenome]|uniref:Uncharacterized protein n=1 Tax=marine metagenome TaxID=408172 RepID=A0A382T7D1_9ZZZZ